MNPTDAEIDDIENTILTPDEWAMLGEYLATNPDIDAEIDLLFGEP